VQINLPLIFTLWLWVALEVGLILRDRERGTGSTASDHGTRVLIMATIVGAIAAAQLLAAVLNGIPVLLVPGSGTSGWQLNAGLAVMWIGLLLRVWAIAILGSAFRTTVEVHAGQKVVDKGPYHWIRHPSYTGLLLLVAGFGFTQGNWISFAVTVLAPWAVIARRVRVEEEVLLANMGSAYAAYQKRSKRLIPGIW
jgi:protein-S-isoprenylcysteine O-methyltransferase Ste14